MLYGLSKNKGERKIFSDGKKVENLSPKLPHLKGLLKDIVQRGQLSQKV